MNVFESSMHMEKENCTGKHDTQLIKKAKLDELLINVCLIEPFYGGSHRQLVDLISKELLELNNITYGLYTLADKKWHWRMMASSLYFAEIIPHKHNLKVIFCSSMVNLAELIGFRHDLNSSNIQKIYYFHENQLNYPLRGDKKTAAYDFQIGWTQIVSCKVADVIAFNSKYNMESFLSKVDSFINKIPDSKQRVRRLSEQFRIKSIVLYFPLNISIQDQKLSIAAESISKSNDHPLCIVWNHRWEYDKNPEMFFQTLFELDENGFSFLLIVLGENFHEIPPIFNEAKIKLEKSNKILHWGYAETKEMYEKFLRKDGDIVVSTSSHEFYGISILEATLYGCYPLCPNSLVYPEFYPKAHLFNSQRQLYKKLKTFCQNPSIIRKWKQEQFHPQKQNGHAKQSDTIEIQDFEKFTWSSLQSQYKQLIINKI